MQTTLNIIQIILAIVLIIAILMQHRGSGLGGAFGGEGSIYRSRRGTEKTLFNITIILASLFVGLAIFNIIY